MIIIYIPVLCPVSGHIIDSVFHIIYCILNAISDIVCDIIYRSILIRPTGIRIRICSVITISTRRNSSHQHHTGKNQNHSS